MSLGSDKYFADASSDPLKYAYKSKFTVHAGAGGAAVAKEEIQSRYKEILRKASSGCVVYIHIPFCQSKCTFCGFAGARANGEERKTYIEALMKEIELITEYPYPSQTPVRAVYLGGGTPSAIEPQYLYRLIQTVHKRFNLANDCEITLEGRTHDFEGSRAKELIDAGFNRFSLGVQSFDTKIRRELGRFCEKEKVIKIIEGLVSHNKAAVIIDLIYGLPGQSADMFVNDLKTAENAGIDGLDTYQLNIFENSSLKKAIESGDAAGVAGIDGQGTFYKAAHDYLIYGRWRQLSLSHYAKTCRERNIYNPWAKRKGGCIAVGAGAGGSIDGWSYYKVPAAQRYMANINKGNFFPDSLSAPEPGRVIAGKVIEQMEKGYLDTEEIFSFGAGFKQRLAPYIENWQKAKLVETDEKYINLTTAGKFWGVNLTQAVIDILTREQ